MTFSVGGKLAIVVGAFLGVGLMITVVLHFMGVL